MVRASFVRIFGHNQISRSNMGARRHGLEGSLATPPSGNVVKCFCALVVTTKRSVDELSIHYFHNLSSASGESPQTLTRIYPWTPLGTFVPSPLICPPLEKTCGRPCAASRNNAAATCIFTYSGPKPSQCPTAELVPAALHTFEVTLVIGGEA